ncbi:class I SAM-dependent methyltransferase [Ruegeria atlantica]|uniref:Methyltransferase domain protein n=1 Tax=Ruegeria atlantica TaxID=81569 RepID=A0A0P1E6L5_9RHOB|nr:class I SAM-dependent methyltransferase [Ruegeria atlantica]CUH44424.1 hypothetical protein RUM4293_03325 [Ruegeria atlantica]
MGIDYSSAKKLIRHASEHGMGQRVLMLGRQRMQVKDRLVPALDRLLDELKLDMTFADLQQEDGYTETFFKALGATTVDSLDISDFEGANLIHDLNAPVPDDLPRDYDLVFDGGTTEHIFDVATCMDNLNTLLAPNGMLCACSPGNNWFAHGFYQFGPELVYGYWKHGCGFDVLDCVMLPEMPRDKELAIPDPASKGTRPRMRGKMPNQRVYLYYEVRKGAQAHRWNRALQTDYVRKWGDHEVASDKDDGEFAEMRRAQTQAASKAETS